MLNEEAKNDGARIVQLLPAEGWYAQYHDLRTGGNEFIPLQCWAVTAGGSLTGLISGAQGFVSMRKPDCTDYEYMCFVDKVTMDGQMEAAAEARAIHAGVCSQASEPHRPPKRKEFFDELGRAFRKDGKGTNGWLAMTDSEPTQNVSLLIAVRDEDRSWVEKAIYNGDGFSCGNLFYAKEQVTHWMLMPEPPEH